MENIFKTQDYRGLAGFSNTIDWGKLFEVFEK
jgi:hypothetical protein